MDADKLQVSARMADWLLSLLVDRRFEPQPLKVRRVHASLLTLAEKPREMSCPTNSHSIPSGYAYPGKGRATASRSRC